jgi:signal transduction histidine kinase
VATTLRTRATLMAALITGLTLLLASVALVLVLEDRLTAGTDALSRQRVDDLLSLAERGDLPRTITTIDDEGVAQVVGDDGRVLAASANITGAPPIGALRPDELMVRTMQAPDDDETETYRVWVARGDSPDGPVTVYVGDSLESVDEASSTLRTTLYVGGPLVLLLLAAGTWLVLGRALRRVDAIRAEVDTITEDRLDRRVPVGGSDDEVGRLATTMNRMLGRLEAARDRQQAFVADVSHDLQSPLAAQRAQLEVARAHPDGTDVGALADDLLATNAEMEHLVRDLLFLAAADAGAPPSPADHVDLDDVVLEEAARARSTTSLRIDTTAVSGAPVRANRAELQRLVRNLLDNALAHARSTVLLELHAGDGVARLDVRDDGSGVPEAERERVFERFHRGDTARTRHTGGSGLGLPIARTLAERSGGTLELADDPGVPPGAHFVLRLPTTG